MISETLSRTPRVVVEKARQVTAKVWPGPTHGRRSLPIRCTPDEIRACWDDPRLHDAILEGIPVAGASIAIGEADRDWGQTVTLDLELSGAAGDGGTDIGGQGRATAEGAV